MPIQKALKPLDHRRLSLHINHSPREVGWLKDPPTGVQTTGTDHMLLVRWTVNEGWGDPKICPYADLQIPATASCIHYATQCYEGMKVYRGHDGKLRLFRPRLNCERLRRSAVQVSLPTFETEELGRLIESLVALDCPRWLPRDRCCGQSLYVRPAMIADGPQIGVRLPETALLFVIIVPWPEIAPDVLENGLTVITSRDDTVRSWPGGFGSSKIGANYGPNFITLGEARAQGYDQVLWLFGEEAIVTECGSSNFFVVWRTRTGHLELITAPLYNRLILPGITRDSILALARERLNHNWAGLTYEPLQTVESQFSMSELRLAHEEGRLLEAFVSGTAYFVTPISQISWGGLSIEPSGGKTKAGSYTQIIRAWLTEIMYGNVCHEWACEITEKE